MWEPGGQYMRWKPRRRLRAILAYRDQRRCRAHQQRFELQGVGAKSRLLVTGVSLARRTWHGRDSARPRLVLTRLASMALRTTTSGTWVPRSRSGANSSRKPKAGTLSGDKHSGSAVSRFPQDSACTDCSVRQRRLPLCF